MNYYVINLETNKNYRYITVEDTDRNIPTLKKLPEGAKVVAYTALNKDKVKKEDKHYLCIDEFNYRLFDKRRIYQRAVQYIPVTDKDEPLSTEKDLFIGVVKLRLMPIILLILLLALIITAFNFCGKDDSKPTPPWNPDLETIVETSDIPAEQRQGSIEMTGFTEVSVSSERKATVFFNNPENNPCYFTFALYLSDDTLLYQSKHVAPGKTIKQIELQQSLSKGEYEGYVIIETAELETGKAMNSGRFDVHITSR